MRILLTGHSGYLGQHLVQALRDRDLGFCTAGRVAAGITLDLEDPDRAAGVVAAAGFDVVLHAGALSAMGACRADPARAQRINGDAVAALARAVPRVVMVSTDLVFDGTAAPYRSDAAPRPLSAYARSKVVGEGHALAADGLVVRIPLLFGPSFDGARGATDMLRAAGPAPLSLFDNEFRTPLHVRDAALALIDLVLDPRCRGVVHVAGPERESRLGIAERFAARHGWQVRPWRGVDCVDPERPRDVSLVSDRPTRSLDAMLDDA